MSEKHVSIRRIAEASNVSPITVSRVLRNRPNVSEKTKKRVWEVANSLGYKPDPGLSKIMTQLQERRRKHIRETIAVIRETQTDGKLPSPTYQYVPSENIKERAERYGYKVDELWLGKDGLTPGRLNNILRARGIRGVIVSPQTAEMPVAKLDYSELAAATFGYGLRDPSLHRSAGNMTLAVQLATSELTKRGYRRIGLAISQWVDDRAESAYSATMLFYQLQIPEKDRIPLFLFPTNDLVSGKSAFLEWFKNYKPDALISFDQWVPDWLKEAGYNIPEDVGLVVHDWTAKMKGLAGIDHRRNHVAAAAVDLVVTQLMQNEVGLPEAPRQILIPPVWRNGKSVGKVE